MSPPRTSFILSVIAGLTTVAVALLIMRELDEDALQSYRQDVRSDVVRDLAAVRGAAEKAINKRVYLTLGLKAHVSVNPDMDAEQFAKIAAALMNEADGIRNVTSIPDNVIRDVYPREGNADAIGLRLLERPDQRAAAMHAIKTGKPWLAGPVKLVQGGEAFVNRAPVYVRQSNDAPGAGRYWGMVSILIDKDALVKEIEESLPKGLEIAIRGRTESGGLAPIFYGREDIEGDDPIRSTIQLPTGGWQIYGIPQGGWPTTRPNAMQWRLFNWGVSLIAGVAAFLAFQLVLPESFEFGETFSGTRIRWNVILPTLVAGIAGVLLFLYSSTVAEQRRQLSFQTSTSRVYNRLQDSLMVYEEAVQSVASLASVDENLNREGFRLFVSHPIKQHKGIQAIEWIPIVKQSERSAFEQQVRDEGFADFVLRRWSPSSNIEWKRSSEPWAEEYYPVYFIEPMLGNEPAFGIDLGSNPSRRAALQRARDEGRPIATSIVRLAQENEEQAGVLIIVPAYRRGASVDTVNLRRQAIIGFAAGVFRVGDICTSVLAENGLGDTQLIVTDATDAADGEEPILFNSAASSATPTMYAGVPHSLISDRHYDFGGRNWKLQFASMSGRGYGADWQSWLILAGSLGTTALLAAFLFSLTGKTAKVHRLVERRTAELKNQQYLLTSLLESIPDPVFFKDGDGKFILVNQAMANDAGLESPEEMLGRTDADIWQGKFSEQTAQDEQRILETGEPLINQEEQPITPGGDDRWVLVTKMALRDDEGNVTGVFGIARDITRRKRLALEVEAARDEAEAASKMKSAFLANTSHEIRTPMNGIIGMADLLSRTDLEPKQQEYLRAIRQSADALTHLINDILDLSKIEAGRMILEGARFSLSDCVGRAIRTVTPQSDEKGLELICRIAPRVPNWLIGDSGRLRQVLVNLVGNAVKFTNHGEVTLNIELAESHRNQGESILPGDTIELEITVSDTGIGIATERREQIFRAFEQADTSTTRPFGGTGLGLSISSQLVNLMGGQMSLESELNVGSAFSFTATFETAQVESRPRPEADTLTNVKTLVIDDNQTNLQILEELLHEWKMPCVITNSPDHGIAEFEAALADDDPFQLVLLDLHMPKMDGFELATRMNSKHPAWDECPVIMLSSSHFLGKGRSPESAGINRFITKPIISSELLESILDQFMSESSFESSDGSEAVANPSSTTRRVLLVEDNHMNQMVATGLLENLNHQVVLAINGQEALDCLAAQTFDVVLMDMHMPVMDGREAMQNIRQREEGTGRHQPIIAMTAEAMVGDREKCLAAGADEYLAKPVTQDRLGRAIDALLERLSLGGAPPSASTQAAPANPADDANAEVLNLSLVRQAFADEAALRNLTRVCRDECLDLLKSLKEGLAVRDRKVVTRTAHTIKSSARTFAYRPLMEAALAVELAGKDDRLEDVPSLLPAVESTLQKFVAALDNLQL